MGDQSGRYSGPENRVLLVLVAVTLLAGGLLPLLNMAPNRLVSGQPVMLSALFYGPLVWLALPVLVLVVLCLMPITHGRLVGALLGWQGVFTGLLGALSWGADRLLTPELPLARVSPGSGLWLMAACCLLGATDCIARLTPRTHWRTLLNSQLWLIPLVMLGQGAFDRLSLMKEYANRADIFHDALIQHLLFLPGTLIPALLIGLPLGWLCYRHRRVRRRVFPVLNIIQTLPSVALFGLLIAPLTSLSQSFPVINRLGISGIGTAPALIALVLYALLPLVRGVVAGLESVPPGVRESAQAMGMSPLQITLNAELPLALPVLLRSLRVVAVQTVGLAVVAALIGAGGFGTLVFQGLLSSALDLVLLGVIPTVAMAVIIDSIFKVILAGLEGDDDDRIPGRV